jgi:hypothetical protein
LGNGLTENSAFPVSFFDGLAGIQAISIGVKFTCVRRMETAEFSIQCVGTDSYGFLGNGDPMEASTELVNVTM